MTTPQQLLQRRGAAASAAAATATRARPSAARNARAAAATTPATTTQQPLPSSSPPAPPRPPPPVEGVLLDIDGVVCVGERCGRLCRDLPDGVADAVAAVRAKIPLKFVTNTTTVCRSELASRLCAGGIPATADDVISPASVAVAYLLQQQRQQGGAGQGGAGQGQGGGGGAVALFVAPGLLEDFAGLDGAVLINAGSSGSGGSGSSGSSGGGDDAAAAAAAAAVDALLEGRRGCRGVVVGDMGDGWSYQTLNQAFRLMVAAPPPASSSESGGAGGAGSAPELLSLGKSRYFRASDGLSLDVGPFTAALEFAAGVEAVVLGKPAAAAFRMASAALGVVAVSAAAAGSDGGDGDGDADSDGGGECSAYAGVVMVGDDAIGDVAGAQATGLRGVLVKTGKYRAGDERRARAPPDAVLPSVAALPAWLEAQRRACEEAQQEGEQG